MDIEDEFVLEGHDGTDRVSLSRQSTVGGRTFEVRATSDGQSLQVSLALYNEADVLVGTIHGELHADEVDQLRPAADYLLGWLSRTLKQTPTANEKVAKARKSHPNAYQPWSADEEADLSDRFRRGASIQDLAEHLGRQPGAISSRLIKLGVVHSASRSWQLPLTATIADVERWQSEQP